MRAINPNLYLNVFHRDRGDLFVMGMIETDASAWPHISLQADAIAASLDLIDQDPRQAAAWQRLKQTDADLEGGLHHVDSPGTAATSATPPASPSAASWCGSCARGR